MYTSPIIKSFLAVFSLFVALGLTLEAASESQLKSQMKARLAQVEALKKQSLVGENNRAYLEVRGNLDTAQRKIVDAENADRKQVYAIIAKKAGTDVSTVEKQRARQIVQRSGSGIWLQDESGKWYQK